MDFIVSDRESVEQGLLVRSAYVVISIRDPDRKKAAVPKQPGCRDVLFLAFHDAEPTEAMVLPADIKLMTIEQADDIHKFIQRYRDQVGAVVVHCEQGMSRSPAVAAAICRSLGGDDAHFFQQYQPNLYVYRMVLERAEVG
jgi:predicted protein tyrosine phosphatase